MAALGTLGPRVGDGGQAAQSAASAWPVFATLGRVALVGARRVRIVLRVGSRLRATWAAWLEVVAKSFIEMTSGMWGFAAHGAISGMMWAGANLLESARNLGGFALMSWRTHALIVVAGARLQPDRACARPHEQYF